MRAAKLNILLLAAGQSRRLGRPKSMVRIQGITLLRRALLLAAALRPRGIFVVVPRRGSTHRHQASGHRVRFVMNTNPAQGLAGSVRLGIRQARYASAILIVPVDMYALSVRDLARLLARWLSHPGQAAAAKIGAHGGVPMILPARYFPAAEQLSGDAGFRGLLRDFRPPPALLDLPAAALDLDTPADLQAARTRPWRKTH